MDKLTIAYDINLGMAHDFTDYFGCEVITYDQLGTLIDDFKQKKVLAAFIPVGTLPYMQHYQVVAQAVMGEAQGFTLQSNFVSTQNIPVELLPKKILGRVNQYCTTSFWAPMIYLMDYLPQNTILTFKDTRSFQDLLHQTAQTNRDGGMVWDIILKKNPQDTDKVKLLFSKNNLPAPVVVVHETVDAAAYEKIKQFITQDKQFYFTGFQAPHMDLINQFLLNTQQAKSYFTIKC